ncbi:MAG: hypothetical protein V4543_18240 [Bacteroidota bacterium]
MELLADLLKILLPAALISYMLFLTVRAFLNKEFERRVLELRQRNAEIVLPIRLQAYERIILLLERISPNNLVLRISAERPGLNVAGMHHFLLQEVREEFNHNLSQQLYMSNEAWAVARNAMEDIIGLVNISSQNLNPEAPGSELAKALLEFQSRRSENPADYALRYIKDEIRSVF